MLPDIIRVNINPESIPAWYLYHSVLTYQGRCFTFKGQFLAQGLKFMVGARIGNGGNKMHHIYIPESVAGDMRGTKLAGYLRHTGHLHRAYHTAKIKHIRLQYF